MRKIKFFGIFVIFFMSFIFHFLYEQCPNFISSIFFPVNESIWEHMKLIATPLFIYSIFEYYYLNKNNIKFNNFVLSYALTIIISIFLYLVIYLPIDYFIGHNIILSVGLLFLIFIFSMIINYYLLNTKKINYSKQIGIILFILIYIIFGYLTYNPIKNHLFYDTQEKNYGIKKIKN